MRRILFLLPVLAGCLILTAAYFSPPQDRIGESAERLPTGPDSPLYRISLKATQEYLVGTHPQLQPKRVATPSGRPTCETTCFNTCNQTTCGTTCLQTCRNTCMRTCWQPSCQHSCGPVTCEVTCRQTCNNTCMSTCSQETCESTCLTTCTYTCTSQLYAGSFNPPPDDEWDGIEPSN